MVGELFAGSTVVVASEQVSCRLAEEAVILSLKAGVYYGLNPVGARIWELIQHPTTVTRVRDAIVGEYDVGPERCEREVLALLGDLAARELIEIQNGTAA
jgi:coenzyme PQQ synthesis protein D (PqqD)